MNRFRVIATTALAILSIQSPVVFAQKSVPVLHPIFDLKEGCLIGGVRNRQWVAAEKFESGIKGPLKLRLYSLHAEPTDITAYSELAECHPLWKAENEKLEDGIAIQSPSWNPLPRVPRQINTHDTTYTKIVGGILRAAGLKKPVVKINEGYKIDLDGDGKDEVVLIASYNRSGVSELSGLVHQSVPGDYALVLVRKIVGGSVRNIFLVKDIRSQANSAGLTRAYHLSAIADMNGDGRMELALYGAYYEGGSTDVIEINGTRLNAVIGCGCEH